jgi:flagellar capping protein FliD
MSELQEAGYVHRFRKSEGRNTIKWITEVYETPDLNPYLSKAEKPAFEKDDIESRFFDIESYDDEKPGDIVSTDSSNNLPSVITDKQLSANADFSLPISLLSEKEVKALKLPLSAWQQHLADEQAERKRSGVIIAANDLNGTLEAAIIKALENGITSIPRIVNYISSPKWRNSNEQTKRGSSSSQDVSNQASGTGFEPGNGRTPEMQAKLEAAFAIKPG